MAWSAASPAEEREVRWVNSSVAADGDGTEAHPWKSLQDALVKAPNARLNIAAGPYVGPFHLSGTQELRGPKTAVLSMHVAGELLVVEGTNFLEGVSLRGGPGVRGVSLRQGAHLTAKGVSLKGPFTEALEARLEPTGAHSSVDLDDVVIQHSELGIRLVNVTQATLRHVQVEEGSKDGIFAARSNVRLEHVLVRGHEYGLSFGYSSEVSGHDVVLASQTRAGLSVVAAHVALWETEVLDSGPFGCVQVVGGHLWLERFGLLRCLGYGVMGRHSVIVLRDGRVTETQPPEPSVGDAVHLRDTHAQLVSLTIQKTPNIGVLVAEGSRVTMADVSLSESMEAAAVSETKGNLFGIAVNAFESYKRGLVVTNASAHLDAWRFERTGETVIWPQCANGASVEEHWTTTDRAVAEAPCIVRGAKVLFQPWTLQEMDALEL